MRTNKGRSKRAKKQKEETLQERPVMWKLSLRHVGLPDVLTMRLGVQCTVGGGGGAVSLIANGVKLNTLATTAGNYFTYGESVIPNYYKCRVVGFDLIAQISSKFTAPSDVLIIPSVESTNPMTTTSTFEQAAAQRQALRRVVGAVGSGRDVITCHVPVHDIRAITGVEGVLTPDYDCDLSTGAPSDPTSLVYLWCVVKTTNGGSYTASTDPVISLRGSLTVEFFMKQLP